MPYVTPPDSRLRRSNTRTNRVQKFTNTPSSARRMLFKATQYASDPAVRQSAGKFVNKVYQYGKNKLRLLNKKKGNMPYRPSRNDSFSGHSTAQYKGRFNTPKKVKRTIEQTCLSQGYHKTVEQFGGVDDPNSVYLTHSTVCNVQVGYTIATAALRKVMTMAGFKITQAFNEIQTSAPVAGTFENPSSADGIRFHFQTRDAVIGTTVNYVYDTTDGQTFNDLTSYTLGGFDQLPNSFIDYMRNNSNAVPYRLAVYKKDYQSAVNWTWILGSELLFEDAHLSLFLNSLLTIQNRTKGAATSLDDPLGTDRVDSQPLMGYIYEFKHGDPRLRHSGPISGGTNSNLMFGRIDERGIDLQKGAVYVNASEPFQPKYFSNISKATKITLQPGDMKKTGFSYKFSGTFKNVLKKLRCEKWFGTDLTGIIGKSQMVCLEEVMRTLTSNKITIAYERTFKIGAIVKPVKRQALLETGLFAQQIDAE